MPALVPEPGAELVDGDAEQPSRETGLGAEGFELPPGAQEGLLPQVVGQGLVAAGELAKKGADGRLIAADQFAKGVGIPGLQDARDQVGVGEPHGSALGHLLA